MGGRATIVAIEVKPGKNGFHFTSVHTLQLNRVRKCLFRSFVVSFDVRPNVLQKTRRQRRGKIQFLSCCMCYHYTLCSIMFIYHGMLTQTRRAGTTGWIPTCMP